MKKLLIILVLLFSSSVFADDVSDFQIEGMSVGDSMLDYFSLNEIHNNTLKNNYKSKEMQKVAFSQFDFFNTYEYIEVNYKSNDKNYIIQSINGILLYEKDQLSECIKLIEKVSSNDFIGNKKYTFLETTKSHSADPSGESISHTKYLELDNGDVVYQCIDWSNKMNYIDHLKVALVSSDFKYWVHNKEYN